MSSKADKKLLVVTQELKFARILADNEKKDRDRALKSLRAWLSRGTKLMELTEDDFKRIWKGLFYSMWMSDKLLIQEECAENIASLVHLPAADVSMLFFKAGLLTLMQEWFGIDSFRIDKFMMLVRRFLRHTLQVLKEQNWKSTYVKLFCEVVSSTILNNSIKYCCLGLQMHFIEIFMEEVAKVSEGNLKPETVTKLVKPFINCLATSKDPRLIKHTRRFIFVYLMRQSHLGLEYQEKYEAWKKLGFPGSINSLKRVKVQDLESDRDEDEDIIVEDKPLDPRAGRVDVELPQIKFSPKQIVVSFEECKFKPETSSKSRQAISRLIEQFTKMASGVYPLGTEKLNVTKDSYDMSIRKAVNRLVKFDKQIKNGQTLKKKHKNKSKRIENEEEYGDRGDEEVEENGDDKDGYEDTEEGEENKEISDEERDGDDTEEILNKAHKKQKKMLNGHQKKVGNTIENGCKRKRKSNDKDGNPASVKQRKLLEEDNMQKLGDLEYVFQRNSGTWYVYDMSTEMGDGQNTNEPSTYSCRDNNNHQSSPKKTDDVIIINSPKQVTIISSPKKRAKLTTISSPKKRADGVIGISSPKKRADVTKLSSPKKRKHEQRPCNDKSPSSPKSPVKLFESAPQQNKSIYFENDWGESVNNCDEYELCIPAMKKAKKQKPPSSLLINKPNILRGKLDARLLRDSLAQSTPPSVKKVKINTKLNTSQEVHEHLAGILASPGIPYDASKRPNKPLLKTPTKPNLVNPFYSKQLEFEIE